MPRLGAHASKPRAIDSRWHFWSPQHWIVWIVWCFIFHPVYTLRVRSKRSWHFMPSTYSFVGDFGKRSKALQRSVTCFPCVALAFLVVRHIGTVCSIRGQHARPKRFGGSCTFFFWLGTKGHRFGDFGCPNHLVCEDVACALVFSHKAR